MNQGITLITDIDLTQERLEEIFSVPKTKQLFDEFVKKEENNETLMRMIEKFDFLLGIRHIFEIEIKVPEAKDVMWQNVRGAIIAEAMQLVISGKPLNQAIQQVLKEQLKDPKVFEKLENSMVI